MRITRVDGWTRIERGLERVDGWMQVERVDI
jgi:hypothetical protein